MRIPHFCRLPLAIGLLAFAGACADPEIAKHRHLKKGEEHAGKGQYAEAILEYRNALKKDQRFGEARFKLAEALTNQGRPMDAAIEFVNAAELLPERPDVQIKAGTILLAAREFQRAQQAAEKALAHDPKSVDAQLILANALAGLKDLAGAVREIEEAIALSPDDARPYTTLGSVRLAEGDRSRAEAAYKQAVAIAPRSITARLALGYFYWNTGARPQAQAELTEAVAIDPKDHLANRMLALFHLTGGQYAEAEPALLRLAEANDPGAILTVADHYARTGRGEDARGMYERLRAIPASRHVAAVRLATLDHSAGRRDQAYAGLDEALKDSPNNAELLAVKAQLLLADRRFEEADANARGAVAADGNHALAQFVLGSVHMARGQTDLAAKAFQETLRLNPRAAGAELQLSRLNLASGQPDDALRRAEAARKAQPNSVDARLGVAAALLGRREFARAEAELKPLVAQFPDSSAVRTAYGGLLAARSDVRGAIREFDHALALDPQNLQALSGRVAADLHLKRPQDGRDRLARALAAAPADANLLLLAGRFELSVGDLNAAERHLRNAVEASPVSLAAYSALAQIYLRQNRLEQARHEFDKLAALRSDPIGPKTMVGMIYDLQNRPEDAKRTYEEAVKLGGRTGVAANNLAWHYAESGEQLDVALELAQTAKQQIPNSHEVDDTLGWVYFKRGMTSMAIPPLERSVKAAPEVALYQYHLGLAYAKEGRQQDARRALERALKLQPDFPGAHEARATLASITQS